MPSLDNQDSKWYNGINSSLERKPQMLIDFFISNYMTLVILFFLAVIVYVNKGVNIPAAGKVKAIAVMIFALLVLDYADDVLYGSKVYHIDISDLELIVRLRTVVTTIKYVLRPIIIMLELYVICPDRKYRLPLAIPAVINACIYLPTMFGKPIAFYIDPANEWIPIFPFTLTIYFAQLCYVFILLLLSVQHFRSRNRTSSLIVLAIFAVSVITAVLEYTSALTGYVTTITAMSVLVYYIYLSTIYQRNMRQEIAEKELEIAQSELAVLKNQMQPHFIYNTLATIRLLAKRDSKQAVKSIDDFSKYLRLHIGAIQSDDLISFTEELENVKLYLSMVQQSYRSSIEIIYELAVTDFKLPPLSLEPIVENAVSHGIGRLGGTIRIITFEENNRVVIRVTDSGGMESCEDEYTPYHNGIGLENTAKRLKLHCGGELKTDFNGEGGVVDVILPILREEEE